MRKVLLTFAFICAATAAQAQSPVIPFVGNSPVSNSNPMPVSASFSPSGTQDINITEILGAAPSLTNPLWITPATGASFAVTGTFWQATQPISAASLPLPALAATSTQQSDGSQKSQVVDGSGNVIGATANALDVNIKSGFGTTIAVTNAGTFAVQPNGAFAVIGITPTDRTITSASGASQQVMAANSSRHSLLIQNTGNANCGVNPTGGTAAIGGAGTLTLVPQGSYQPRVPTLSAVTVICTAGQPLYANEN